MGQIVLAAMTAPDDVSPMELREIADFVVRPRLLTIPGVAQVIPIGGEVSQFRVAPNPSAMRALGVTQAQIETALASFGANTGGASPDQYSREFLIRNIGKTMRLEISAPLRSPTSTTVQFICDRSPRSVSARGLSAATRATWASRRDPFRREAARRRHDHADASG